MNFPLLLIIKHKDDELSCDSNPSISLNISETITQNNLEEHITFLELLNKNYQEIFEKGTKLSIIIKILNVIKQFILNIISEKHYIFYIEEKIKEKIDEETNETKIEKIKNFYIFCFSPHLGFSDILKCNPFSIIFTSGTLAPFKLYENELQIKFDITLENNHIIPNEQINFNIISSYQDFESKGLSNSEVDKNIDIWNKIDSGYINFWVSRSACKKQSVSTKYFSYILFLFAKPILRNAFSKFEGIIIFATSPFVSLVIHKNSCIFI